MIDLKTFNITILSPSLGYRFYFDILVKSKNGKCCDSSTAVVIVICILYVDAFYLKFLQVCILGGDTYHAGLSYKILIRLFI